MPAFSFRIPLRFLRGSYSRLALTVVALACGVALVVAIRVMNAAVLASFLDTVDEVGGRAAFSVVAADGASFSEGVVDIIGNASGVKLAVPLVSAIAFPNDDSGELLTVHGVDLTHDADVRLYHRSDGETVTSEIIDDLLVFLNQDDSIVIGKEFAERRLLKKGDYLDLITPHGLKRFTIRGLLDSQGLEHTLGGRLVVMDLFAAQRSFAVEGQVTRIDVVVKDDVDATPVISSLGAILPAGLRIEESSFRKQILRETVSGFQGMLVAFGLLAVVAGFVICYGRLSVVFEMRAWHIGVMRAVGLSRPTIFATLIGETLTLGILGALLGIPVGVAVGYFGLPLLATATAMNFRLPVSAANHAVQIDAMVLGAAVSIVAALAAAIVPAVRVARIEPIAALGMRGQEIPVTPFRGRATLRWGLLGTVVALVLVQQADQALVALGNVTTALVALAACAFAAPIVRVGSRALTLSWERWFGPMGRVASGNLAKNPRRTSLTVATLGVGLGVVLLFGILGWSFEKTLIAASTARLQSDLIVSSAFTSGGYRSAPISEEVLGEMAGTEGVAEVAGVQERDIQYLDGSAVLYGYDKSCFRSSRVCQWPLSGGSSESLELVARGEAVMVSTSFAHQFGVRPGDSVRLLAPAGILELPVAAVTTAEPVKAVIMDRDRYRSSWNDRLVSWIYVSLTPGAGAAKARAAIARDFGQRHRLRIQSNTELVEYFASQARKAFSLQYVMEAITFALLMIGVGDTLAAGVAERTREFGIMRAVGVRRRFLCGIVLLEGIAVGLFGVLLALAVGLVLGTFWVEVQFPAILGWKLDLHLPLRFMVGAGALSLLICLTASLLPSLKAGRLEPGEALRYE